MSSIDPLASIFNRFQRNAKTPFSFPDIFPGHLRWFRGALRCHSQSKRRKYIVPEDNPFVQTPGAYPEIYALGLRNPFRMTRRGDGTLFVAGVGSYTWEEVNCLGRQLRLA